MAVLFAKVPSQKETVNDLHGHLINLAMVVQDEALAPRLYERLDRTLMCEGLFEDAASRYDDNFLSETPDIEAAYWYFVVSWMGRNGIAGTKFGKRGANHAFAVRWTNGGGSPTVRFDNAVSSLPDWHRRLKNVVILRRDALKILDRPDDAATTAIYVDPPYFADSRSGFTGSGGHSRYVHEFEHAAAGLFASDDDHARLAEILNGYKHARIVVSYYDCPRARELYDGWTFVDHARQKHLHAQNGRGARPKEAPEVLIINGPSYA